MMRVKILFLWMLLSFLLTLTGVSTEPSNKVWTVSMGDTSTLVVQNQNLSVNFKKKNAWTIQTIQYMDQAVVNAAGLNGSVVNAKPKEGSKTKDPWIGTGHGREDVKSISAIVDKKKYELKKGLSLSGNEITICKESIMGHFAHTARITFPESGDRVIEKHSYTVLEDLNDRFQFFYAFMHCNANALDQWLAQLGNGKEREGEAGKKNNQFTLKSDIKSIIFYSKVLKKGIAYVYPEVYKGADTFKNSIWDRNLDNKLYFRPEVKSKYKVGDQFEYIMEVIPFSAQPTEWKKTGRRCIK